MTPIKISISICWLLALSITALAQNDHNQSKNQKKEKKYEVLKTLIQSENYQFVGRTATASKGKQIDLTSRNNFLKVSVPKATASMPYFGRAYIGGYSGGDGGINFDGQMDNYEIKYNDKKMRVNVNFKVKGESDTFTCSMTISSLDNVSLTITSFKKKVISYRGYIGKIINNK